MQTPVVSKPSEQKRQTAISRLPKAKNNEKKETRKVGLNRVNGVKKEKKRNKKTKKKKLMDTCENKINCAVHPIPCIMLLNEKADRCW
jgi:hypothetical protein